MSITVQRVIFAVLVSLSGTLAALAHSGAIPAPVAVWVIFVSGTINGTLQVLSPQEPK